MASRCSWLLGARMTNIQEPLFRYRVHSTESLSRQSGGVREMAVHRAAVSAANKDVLTRKARKESARRRDLEITVESALDNLRIVEQPHRPTILVALPFTLIGGAERLLSAVVKHLTNVGYRIVIITTIDQNPAFGDSSPWFEAATSEIYHLPRLLRHEYWVDFLEYVVDAKDIDVILVAGGRVRLPPTPHTQATAPRVASRRSALQHRSAREEQSEVRRPDRLAPVRKRGGRGLVGGSWRGRSVRTDRRERRRHL